MFSPHRCTLGPPASVWHPHLLYPSPTTPISNKILFTWHYLPQNLAKLEAIAVNVLITNISPTIICYYNPPTEALSSQLFQYALQLPNSILMGDFSSRHIDFGDTFQTTGHLINFPIYRLENRQPTFISHQGQSIIIIDHIIISEKLTLKCYFMQKSKKG